MPAEIYEIAALAARFWFLFLMVMIVWHSYRWYARDRRLRKKRLKDLPDAGYIGEFVVMESTGSLKQGDVLAVPFEGTLGLLRNNDVYVEAEGVAPRHLWFRYDREQGLRMLPLDGNEFTVDHTPIGDAPEGLYVVHGSRLYVGRCQLRLRMFEGYEVQQQAGPAAARPGSPWPDQLLGAPVYGAAQPQEGGYLPVNGAASFPQPQEQLEGLLPDRWRENPYAQPAQAEPSPYGQRVRSRFTASRSRQQDAAMAGQENPYRSRRSIPGLSGSKVYRSTEPSLRHSSGWEAVPPQASAVQTAAHAQPSPAAEEKPAAPQAPAASQSSVSAMSVYARLMAQAARDGESNTQTPPPEMPMPAAAAKPAAAAVPAQPVPGEAAKPAAPATPQTTGAKLPLQKPKPEAKAPSAPVRPQKPLPPTVRPVSLEGVSITPTFAPAAQDMVFEEPVPEAASLAPEEVFHPLMDDDDWEEWESEPLPEEQPVPAAAPKAAEKKETLHPQKEDWPYLARPDQWQSEGLFADLLDEDGTDAALPRSAYTDSDQAGNTTRRMLNRYFRGGGM